MDSLDFLSSSPSLYLLKEKRGKNKLRGFFSIILALVMISLMIYYFYIYFFGLKYSLIYYRDHWLTYMNNEQKKSINKPKTFYFYIHDNPNNAKIIPIVRDYSGVENLHTNVKN